MHAARLNTDQYPTLRLHPRIHAMFRIAESRHLTEEELQEYENLMPDLSIRAMAAREVIRSETSVVKATVDEIFMMYPFQQKHEVAPGKAMRDITYISIYATHTMLLDDPAWFRDKLLIWLKTILQSFYFPTRTAEPQRHPELTRQADRLPIMRSAIYDTYARLKINYKDVLSPDAFALMEHPLQQAVDVLSGE